MKNLLIFLYILCTYSILSAQDCDPNSPPYLPANGCACAFPDCDFGLNGFSATLRPSYYIEQFPECPNFVINNDDWIAFVAGSTSIDFTVFVSNCLGVGDNGGFGLQAAIFNDCSEPVTPTDEGYPGGIIDEVCNCSPYDVYLNYDGFILGKTYYMVIDGCGGDICDYTIQVNSGSTYLPPLDSESLQIYGPDYILNDENYTFYTDNIPFVINYDWSVTGGEINYISPAEVSVLITDESNFEICVVGSNDCSETMTSCQTVGIDPDLIIIEETLCEGDCYNFNGQLLCSAGVYDFEIDTGNGIEHYRIILDFITYTTYLSGEVCFGECFEYNGEDYCSNTTQTFFYISTEGCDSTVFLDVIVLNDNDIVASASVSNDLDCGNLSTVLNGMSTFPNVNYLWTGPGISTSNENEQNPEVTEPGIYNLVVSTDAGCSSSTTIEVIANQETPVITIEGNHPFDCFNDQNIITASSTSPDMEYEWSGPGGFHEVGNMVTITELGTYTLVGYSAPWCTNTITFEVDLGTNLLEVDPGPNRHIQCEFVLTLDAPGSNGSNVLYQWSTQDGNILNGENTLNPLVNAAGTYTLTATSLDNGCVESADMIVYSELAIIEEEDLELTCIISSVQLDATESYTGNDATFEWSTADGNIIAGENTLTPTVDAGGVYQLLVNRPGCTSFASISVADNANPPSIDIEASSTVITCFDNVTLTAVTDATDAEFTWSRGIAIYSTEAAFSTNTPGTYTLLIETPNGCSSTMSIEIEEAFDPDFIVVFVEQEPLCDLGGFGSLSAFVGGDEPFYEIYWNSFDGEIVGSPFGEFISILGAGTYCAEAFNSNTGCSVVDCVTVTEVGDLIITENITEPSCASANDGNIEIIISGGTAPFTFEWNTSPTQTTQNIYDIGPGTYEVIITDDTGCETSATFVVEAGSNDIVTVDAGGNQTFDCTMSTLSLDGSASEYPVGSTFLWETNNGIIESGSETLSPVISSVGMYSLTIFSPNGCSKTEVITVSDYEADAGLDQVLDCNHPVLELSASNGPAGSEYEWTTSNGNIIEGENTITPLVDEPGIYSLLVTTENGCSYTDEVVVTLDIVIPDVIVMDDEILLENCNEVVNLYGESSTSGVSYFWSGPQGTTNEQEFSVELEGVYELVVVAPNGCTNSATTILIDDTFLPVISSDLSIQYLNCFNGNPLLLDLSIESLTNDLDINWGTADGSIVEQIGNSITVDERGTYEISVFDNGNNCSSVQTFIVEEEDAFIEVSSTIASCGIADATATVSTEFIHDPVYLWNTGETTATINGLSPGIYTVTISAPQSTCDEVKTIEVVQDPSCFVVISGFIYDDENMTCDLGGSIEPKENVSLTIAPEDLETFTDANGYYEFLVPPGDYSITPQLVSPFVVECPAESINVSVPAGASGSDNNNFFVKALSGFDLYVTANSGSANAGSNQFYQMTYCNNAFTTIFGTLEFTHDPLLMFDPIASGASSYNPDTYTAVWDFEDLSFFECEFLSFQVFVPEDIPDGTIISSSITVLPTMGDIAPNNNSVSWTKRVNNSGSISSGDPDTEAIEVESNEMFNDGTLVSEIKQYPNPFSDQTIIEFTLEIEEELELQVFDANGRLVKAYTGFRQGFNILKIPGSDLPVRGIYFYRIVGPSVLESGRMIKH